MRTTTLVGMVPTLALAMAGCSSQPQLVHRISGTDRDRVLVEVTFEVDPTRPADPDWDAAREKALNQCRQWGDYNALEPFGDRRTECEAANRYRQCTRYYVAQTWRCLKQEKGGDADRDNP